MKLVNSKTKEKPMVEFEEPDQQTSIIIMDEFTWADILKWTKEYNKKQLSFLSDVLDQEGGLNEQQR